MIEVTNVTKTHGAITSADQVSFTAEAGVVTGLLGPNGAGKSSVMRIICDLDRADADGRAASGNLGAVPEDLALLREAFSDLGEVRVRRGKPPKRLCAP